MNLEKIKSLIRIAQKGRLIEIGNTPVKILMKRKRARLVIIAADASEKLKKQYEFDCLRQNIPIFIFSTRDELGQLCNRDSVVVIAISDKNLAEGIKNAFA